MRLGRGKLQVRIGEDVPSDATGIGDTVRVEFVDGTDIVGTLAKVDASQLSLQVGGDVKTFKVSDVKRIGPRV